MFGNMIINDCLVLLTTFVFLSSAYRYDPAYTEHNLNQNKTAIDPLDYWGEWKGHEYTPSPKNWRFPFYTLFLDRFVNGDPSNDNSNGTAFEHDIQSNQMRHGGDLDGLTDTLDYIKGMGVKGLYIAGSPFINAPSGYDSYSPLDLTILDPHFGTIAEWRKLVDEIHSRDMYVLLDNTFATMGDLIGFEGYLNTTTPFTLDEHEVLWKTDRQYWDFNIGNTYNKTCEYPAFWNETGYPVDDYVTEKMKGCYDSEFDQYGDTEAFGVYPDWRRELSKFASVQDRLREWHPPVRAKIEHFYCMAIAMLDVDGFRYDKATQSTVDAMGYMNAAMRACARRYNKQNFFLPGEITGGNDFASIFLGRGRQPDQLPENATQAVTLTSNSSGKYFLRDPEFSGLDSGAFHYTTYRTMTRFLGMDGNLAAGYDAPVNWVDQWNTFLLTNDLINANTGEFDPRHMFGVTNQDVFRWPAITQGTERQLLGHFVTSILLPGIPLLLWGEEQAFYVLDNTASNYIFGRQAMSGAEAWKTHGCYALSSTQYYQFPVESARYGCEDPVVAYDHRDPSAPVRNIIHHMMHLREAFPVLNDGFYLQQLSNQTVQITYPGSSGVQTETGLWSVMRSSYAEVQDLGDDALVWLVYSNLNRTRTYEFDCSDKSTDLNTTALISPFSSGTTVKNLFYPYDQHTLKDSKQSLGINGSDEPSGCLGSLEMDAYAYKAYVPVDQWVGPRPMITKFSPGHDARILSSVGADGTETVDVELQFSVEMDCDSVTQSITFRSTTDDDSTPNVDESSVSCKTLEAPDDAAFVGAIQSTWSWSATLAGVANGVHSLTVRNASAENGNMTTDSVDRFLFRVGQVDNPVVFSQSANYSTTLLSQGKGDKLKLHHSAAGADMYRYSTNFGSSFSDWKPYVGGSEAIQKQPWSGTELQAWKGDHVRVEYFSKLAGSSDHVQQADLGDTKKRRFPHLFLNGPYNQYGFDAGLDNQMKLVDDHEWRRPWMVEWSPHGSLAQINVWGINPDDQPDQTAVYGDADGDGVLDRLPPSSLSELVLNVTKPPPKPYLSWVFVVDDGSMRFQLQPAGSMWEQLILYILLWTVPVILGALATWLYVQSFYKVKFNEVGAAPARQWIPAVFRKRFVKLEDDEEQNEKPGLLSALMHKPDKFLQTSDAIKRNPDHRRTVLIATMEYDIEDWEIKIKIGGLGVMAQLMGKNLGHQDLIWVVPCVGGVEYPRDQEAEPMTVTIMDQTYDVEVQYHQLRNITYVLLDAPVFRQQTKAEPYPARMDDMDSAVYYSAWNQCIAQAITRFPIDLYHINDYHGTVAPLYLLPRSVPACLSLHNAEFQGLWPMRTKKERNEVASVFNLPWPVVAEFVMFGEVFNLLHAGASYLRVFQQGFGAVGVSKKYGKRSFARYPILWGLKKVQALPNPDPSDTGEWDKKLPNEKDIHVDDAFEKERLQFRVQAQEWAGLEKNEKAELFVFVGRWSMQKGVDLIADVFPAILEDNSNVQLIAIGPVIDLYGKFAALKLERLMEMYPGRVCSKPVFTALPPFVFTGAEFALIPSRDEPFGLVAVEFGRKGALGVGARVGGLGQMPGWWFTVESTTTAHLIKQFKEAISEAMHSSFETRAMMRARSAKQRFPVAQWVEDLEILQSTSIRIHDKVETELSHSGTPKFMQTPPASGATTPVGGRSGTATPVGIHSRNVSHATSNLRFSQMANNPVPAVPAIVQPPPASQYAQHNAKPSGGLSRRPSLGSRRGPGHARTTDKPDGIVGQQSKQKSMPPIIDLDLEDSASLHAGGDDTDHEGAAAFSDSDDDGHPRLPPTIGRARVRDSSTLGEGDNTWPLRSPTLSQPPTPDASTGLFPPPPALSEDFSPPSRNRSTLSLQLVVGERTDFKLQKVDPFFTDSTGLFYREFEEKLKALNSKNSESSDYIIEEFLVKSEKDWFNTFRNAKLGRLKNHGSSTNLRTYSQPPSTLASRRNSFEMHGSDEMSHHSEDAGDEFLLGADYKPPTGMRKWMQLRLGDWPLYAFLLALGQIMAANSYQITLLTGENGQTASKLYVVASIYLAASACWWVLFRRLASVHILSAPFFFYGLAFLLVGVAPSASPSTRQWIQNVATGFYSLASASGAFYFSLNFGDEGGAQIKAWVFRACVIQGSQQIYVVALWWWGSAITRSTSLGNVTTGEGSFAGTWKITAITIPIAFALWGIGVALWTGLPTYYRQMPGTMPSFYSSIAKRKVIVWFLVTTIIQNFFLSAPYGRNWAFLFGSQHAETWQVFLLVLLFFIGVWSLFLALFGYLSRAHSWILPLFAIGLGAPRWAQIWWGTSNIGLYLPWAGGYVASALVSRSLWLWLGVLDAVQGVGLGMILLGTLTRVHVAFAVTAMQVVGSITTIIARAVAPNRIGPGPVSPDISAGAGAVWTAWFWVGLVCNLLIAVGFFKFYRKEQLQKP
ncbi:Cell wall alpha-1,3-glucan synthase ags1 [Saxophila tyrrhenica]|uniref:alpha-1,3-glucan synthase n=1 Tax=Saxophila tyrrhenica TaxID=1690608 RepID=A0AAV9PJ50_9PEZI|nr:Cell wall alpha-1,3-glucan synthase ags1 [Saxophila tyrrhenica]